MLTVRDVVGDLGINVVAGAANLDGPVRWVHISELPDPTPWLSGGELLLTTGMMLGTARQQRDFVGVLADRDVAGIGFGTGFSHDEVPAAIVEAAEACGLPLFEVPYDVPFIAITERAFTTLVNEQFSLLQRSIAAQERLQRIVLSEQGLDAIVGALASLVGGTAIVFDGRGELQSKSTFRRELDGRVVRALGEQLGEHGRRSQAREFIPELDDLPAGSLALPINFTQAPDGGRPQAWLVVARDDGDLAEIDRLILHQAVSVIALELLRRRVADTTERRLSGDVLSAAIEGELEGAELSRRLEPFGLGARVTTLVLAPGERATETCESALAEALRDESVSALVARNGRFVCALLPGLPDDELFELGKRVTARVARDLGALPRAGAGRVVAATRVRESWHEARFALEAREMSDQAATAHPAGGSNGRGAPGGDDGPVLATYRDLGSFQLLLSLQDSQALGLFCDSLLGPIESGDGHYGGELMRSLEAFIECNGQWEAAARRLYCHRHTLRYRIRKIEELTGRNLGSARDRIEFWLALRGREIVGPVGREARR